MSFSGQGSPCALERTLLASSLSSAASSSGGLVLLADKRHFTTETVAVLLPHGYT